jgi:hypothetical protein
VREEGREISSAMIRVDGVRRGMAGKRVVTTRRCSISSTREPAREEGRDRSETEPLRGITRELVDPDIGPPLARFLIDGRLPIAGRRVAMTGCPSAPRITGVRESVIDDDEAEATEGTRETGREGGGSGG